MPTQSPGKVCPLCDATARERDAVSWQVPLIYVECDRCGQFLISKDALEYVQTTEIKPRRYLLSAACRKLLGIEQPKILTQNLKSFMQQAPQLTMTELLDRMLVHIADTTHRVNEGSRFDINKDYPLFTFRDPSEAMTHCYLLLEARLIHDIHANTPFRLTIKGWERVSELQQSGPSSRFVFVAMNFDKTYSPLFNDVIAPAIRDAKYEPIRVDRTEHTNRIDDEIIAQIKRSRFAVADFSGQKYGVYFEAGFAMGLGRRVIWTCEESEIDANKLHFDIRQFNFIPWKADNFDDARKRLTNRIVALEGEGA